MNHPRTGPAPIEAGIRNARSTGSWLKHVHDLPLTLGSLVILLYLTVPLGVVLGRTFEPAKLAVARTITYGEDAYGFWKAMLCSADPGRPVCDYVKIEFQSESQLSRIEIDADQAE